MSDTVIFARNHARPPPAREQATVPIHSFTLEPKAAVEVVEAAPSQPAASLLDIINALLAKESVSREDLLSLRARLRRYTSEVNVLASLLRALLRDLELPDPGR